MHKQYLWIDRRGADLHWPALGNVNIGATGKGTLALWVSWPVTNVQWSNDRLWAISCDANNYLTTNFSHALTVVSGGNSYGWPHPDIDRTRAGAWELMVYQWDFSQGIVQSFYNAATPGAAPLTGVPAPVGQAQYLQLGYAFSSPTTFAADDLEVHGLAIWDNWMTAAQMTALYERGHLDEFHAEDGTGNLTFLLALNETLEADVAGGDSTSTVGSTTPKDRYCFLYDGALKLGTMTYPVGMPRQDGSEDDRKPLNAVCPLNFDSAAQEAGLTDQNLLNYSVLSVQNYTDVQGAGAHCRSIPMPGTYRQIVHVPATNNQPGAELGLGPIMYKHYPPASTGVFDQFGSGRGFTVVSDAGNTATAFKTDLDPRFGTDYWNGAQVTFFSGGCQGRALQVAGYDGTTQIITLEAALPVAPAAGDIGFVSPYSRLIGRSNTLCAPDYAYSLEANLWANNGTDQAFLELEWGNTYGTSLMRYGKGRTTYLPGVANYWGTYGVLYGKGYGPAASPATNLEIWLRKVELSGPQTYQILRRDPGRPGPALADNFMVLTRDSSGNGGDSVKVWRQQNLALQLDTPTKYQNYTQATADLAAAGTWRNAVVTGPVPISYDETAETATCALLGQDASGKLWLGYVVGHWDESSGRVLWADEPPPAGKLNPCLDWTTLRTDVESDAPIGEVGQPQAILQSVDGSWSLFYVNQPDLVDDFETYALHGAADRWSWDFTTQFAGPIVPMFKGVDTRDPLTGNGFIPWANQHLPWNLCENPYAQQIERRYLGYSGAKTIYNDATTYSQDTRPVVGCAGADTKSLAPLPYGNAVTPLVAPQVDGWVPCVLGQEDCLAIMFAYGNTSGVGLLTSEDGVHFQQLYSNWPAPPMLIPPEQLPGESYTLQPSTMLRLGDRRVYYYNFNFGTTYNFVSIRWNGETHYDLASGQTAGWLETPILEQPAGSWPDLFVNATPGTGVIQVELRDPVAEQLLGGWGAAECDAIADNVRGRVSWGSQGLTQLTAPYVRVRFYLQAGPDGSTPHLYGWETGTVPVPVAPQVGALQVEGQPAPAGLGAAHPRFSWTYYPTGGHPQAAFQVQVASSQELLDAGTADMWDSGVVLSSATSVVYAGQKLGDFAMYFWRVRVRDTEGEWSETW
jgi:hypothetical protein